mgnify:CR=1 FL=1
MNISFAHAGAICACIIEPNTNHAHSRMPGSTDHLQFLEQQALSDVQSNPGAVHPLELGLTHGRSGLMQLFRPGSLLSFSVSSSLTHTNGALQSEFFWQTAPLDPSGFLQAPLEHKPDPHCSLSSQCSPSGRSLLMQV